MKHRQSEENAAYRQPRQRRSRESLDRIVQAAEGLLEEKGPEALKVSEVADRACVSIGSFYGRFDGKDALLQHLDHRFRSRLWEYWQRFLDPKRWRRRPIVTLLRAIVGALVRGNANHESRLRALALSACLNPRSESSRDTADLNAFVVGKVRRLLLERRNEIAHPDPEKAAEFGIRLVLAAVQNQTVFKETAWNPIRLPQNEMIDELTRCWLAYLGIPEVATD